jgi:hypothetical protein
MGLSAEDIIRGGSLPTKSVPVCMQADLQAEHEDLERQLQDALTKPRDSLAAGGNAAELSARIEQLEERMREHTVTFKLQARRRPDWKELVGAHPPRQADDGTVDVRDMNIGVNAETFFSAMIRACCVEPQLPDEVWSLLFEEKLTDRQFDELSNAAWALNRRDVDVPFSRAASRIRDHSESE